MELTLFFTLSWFERATTLIETFGFCPRMKA